MSIFTYLFFIFVFIKLFIYFIFSYIFYFLFLYFSIIIIIITYYYYYYYYLFITFFSLIYTFIYLVYFPSLFLLHPDIFLPLFSPSLILPGYPTIHFACLSPPPPLTLSWFFLLLICLFLFYFLFLLYFYFIYLSLSLHFPPLLLLYSIYIFPSVLADCTLSTPKLLNVVSIHPSLTLVQPSWLSSCSLITTPHTPSHIESTFGCWLSFLVGLLTLEDGTDTLSGNIGKQLPHNAAQCPRRAQFSSTSQQKPEIKDSYIFFNTSIKFHTSHNYIQLLKNLRQWVIVLFVFRTTSFPFLLFKPGTPLPYSQLLAAMLCSYQTFRQIKYYQTLASRVQCFQRQKHQRSFHVIFTVHHDVEHM
jgi:hypothetical protein